VEVCQTQSRSDNVGEIHIGHPDHKLVLKNYKKNPTHATTTRSQLLGYNVGVRTMSTISTNTICSTNPPPATTSSQNPLSSSSSGHRDNMRDDATSAGSW
ncbi:hypothetical protein Dsin_010720, partial [Dipteronia sinensis]